MKLRPIAFIALAAALWAGSAVPADARQPQADDVGLSELPPAPDSKRVNESKRHRRSKIKRGELTPTVLVPFRVRADGAARSGSRFFDDQGGVFRHREAVLALTEACPDEMADFWAKKQSTMDPPSPPDMSAVGDRPGVMSLPTNPRSARQRATIHRSGPRARALSPNSARLAVGKAVRRFNSGQCG